MKVLTLPRHEPAALPSAPPASEIRQQALTVVLDVLPGRGEELAELLRSRREAVLSALRGVSTLHFGRFVVLPPAEDEAGVVRGPHRLAIESNFDGELEPHLEELGAALGSQLDEIGALCEGFPSAGDGRAVRRFLADRALRAQAFYVAYPGLAVATIRNDAELRRIARAYLAARQADGSLRDANGLDLARDLVEHVREVARARGLYVGPVARWSPRAEGGALSVFLRQPLTTLTAFLLAPLFELWDRLRLRKAPRFDAAEIEKRRDEIGRYEDRLEQNELSHLVPIKPGAYRLMTLGLMLRAADALARLGAKLGRLGGVSSVHCARWVVLPSRELLFLGSYDGTWEALLGDFIDKAAKGLTMIWTNTARFPKTRLLLWRGARRAEVFKRWVRRHQLPAQIWYSAHPDLSVTDVLRNARFRELLAEPLDAQRARALLGMT